MSDFNVEEHPRSVQYHLKNFMDAFGNVFFLNIFFVLFSLPVVTIGASLTALYSVCLKLVNKEEPQLWKAFIHAFKVNFKKATIVWLLLIAAFIVLWGDNMLINTVEGGLASFYTFVSVVEIVLLVLVIPFLFPLIAKFDNTVGNYFKNSILMAISNLGSWLKVALIWFAPTVLSLRYPVIIISTWYIWLLFMFGLMAYLSSKVIHKMLLKTSAVKETEEKKVEEKNEKRRQFLNVHERATSYVNPAEDDEDDTDIDEKADGKSAEDVNAEADGEGQMSGVDETVENQKVSESETHE